MRSCCVSACPLAPMMLVCRFRLHNACGGCCVAQSNRDRRSARREGSGPWAENPGAARRVGLARVWWQMAMTRDVAVLLGWHQAVAVDLIDSTLASSTQFVLLKHAHPHHAALANDHHNSV